MNYWSNITFTTKFLWWILTVKSKRFQGKNSTCMVIWSHCTADLFQWMLTLLFRSHDRSTFTVNSDPKLSNIWCFSFTCFLEPWSRQVLSTWSAFFCAELNGTSPVFIACKSCKLFAFFKLGFSMWTYYSDRHWTANIVYQHSKQGWARTGYKLCSNCMLSVDAAGVWERKDEIILCFFNVKEGIIFEKLVALCEQQACPVVLILVYVTIQHRLQNDLAI